MLGYVGKFLAGAAIGGALGGAAILLADYMSARDRAKREKIIAENGFTSPRANLAHAVLIINGAKK